ncbi:MAG: YihY/virulence factor BrkB family protein [Actinobacteria bacterium]|nr:YihY/virulence factor BrkB family protein [Actinomycetota bacterium]
MDNPGDKGEQLNLDRAELRGVARRPAEGSLKNFLRDMRSLVSVRTLRAAVAEFQRDDALGLAAQLAFYLILALFPFLLVLVSLMGTFSNEELASDILGYFQQVTPQQVYGIIETYLSDTISGSRPAPGLFSVGLIVALWSASGAFAALINALNRAYDVEETRPIWKVRGIALLMTLGLSVIILIAVLLLVFGPPIGRGIADLFGLGSVFEAVWNIVRWPVALFFMVLTVALVIVLLLYLYISSLTILFGAELNATLVRMKEEISGQQILDAEPAGAKPDILEEDQQDVRG